MVKSVPTKTIPTRTIPIKIVPTSCNEKKVTCKIENVYILLTFLLIAKPLLIIVSIYFYLIKHRSEQEHLLPYHDDSNKLKGTDINKKI